MTLKHGCGTEKGSLGIASADIASDSCGPLSHSHLTQERL